MTRCVLATALNHLVYSGVFAMLQLVRVDAVAVRHDPSDGAHVPALFGF
jgi:hypothetical protein